MDLNVIFVQHDADTEYAWVTPAAAMTEHDIEANPQAWDATLAAARDEHGAQHVRVAVIEVDLDEINAMFEVSHRIQSLGQSEDVSARE